MKFKQMSFSSDSTLWLLYSKYYYKNMINFLNYRYQWMDQALTLSSTTGRIMHINQEGTLSRARLCN